SLTPRHPTPPLFPYTTLFRSDVNTVFQDYALFPHMSVGDNVAYGLVVRKVGKAERLRRVGEALDMVRLAGYEKRRPTQLSGGQRDRKSTRLNSSHDQISYAVF